MSNTTPSIINSASSVNSFCKKSFDQDTKFTDQLFQDIMCGKSTLLQFVTHCLVHRLDKYSNYTCNAFQFVTLTNGQYSFARKISKYQYEFILCNTRYELKQEVTASVVKQLLASHLV